MGLMMRGRAPGILVGLAVGLTSAAAVAQDIAVPSGQVVSLFDVVLEPEGNIARFRFLAPGIGPEGGAVPFETVQGDFQWLCDNAALPALAANGWEAGQVIVSMSDVEIEFGASDAGVVQFFEGFRVENGACIWEAY